MSRLKNFTWSLASGYLQIGVNMLYTLASVPLALHYLSTAEFGLWAVAMSITGYLLLIDFGMTGAAARILIDHKDNPAGGAYGSVIKISIIVSLIQGLIVAVAGTGLSFVLPRLVNVPAQFHRDLFFLVAGLCVLQGTFFVTRIFWSLGAAHQRYDLYNYTALATLIVQFVAMWVGFREGLGIYSMLVAAAVGSLFSFGCGWISSVRHGFFPVRGCWGRFDRGLFKEVFFLGSDQFLIAVGTQLTTASQLLIISHVLDLTAAAVWSVATKPFMLALQLVGRIFAFASSPLAEMVVRGERERFRKRFRDLVILCAAIAVFVAGGIALCNESFLRVWTQGRIAWSPLNDVLLAVWFVVVVSTSNHISVLSLTKNIGRMRYIYFGEGVLFVIVAIAVAPHFGIPGIILAAIVADLLCSGIFGVRRTMNYFCIPVHEVMNRWMGGPIKYFLLLSAVLIVCRLVTEPLPPVVRLVVNAALSGIVGLWLLWQVGLTPDLRGDLRGMAVRLKDRLPKSLGWLVAVSGSKRVK